VKWLTAATLCLIVVVSGFSRTTGPAKAGHYVLLAAQVPVTGDATFRVVHRGVAIGTARSSVVRTPGGWTVAGSGELGPPHDLRIRRFEAEYTDAWAPRAATIEMATPAEQVVVHGAFDAAAGARIDIVRDGRQVVFVTAVVSPGALILPSLAFSAYEALAARLATASAGLELKAYVLPHREITVLVERARDDALRGRSGRIDARRWRLTLRDPAGPVTADIWTAGGRLVRLSLIEEDLTVERDDVEPR
jgi:hypothetical protein